MVDTYILCVRRMQRAGQLALQVGGDESPEIGKERKWLIIYVSTDCLNQLLI